MATTITIKLNKDASQFQAGDSLGFGIRGGVQYYDRDTKQKEWTNYEAVVFAKPGPQADFYAQSLVAGSVVEVTGLTQKIRQFNGQNGLILSIELMDAKVGMIHTGAAQQQQQHRQQAPQQRPAQQPQRQAPQQRTQPQAQQYHHELPNGDEWQDDIPFNHG